MKKTNIINRALSFYGILITFAILTITGTIFWNINYSIVTDIIGQLFFGLAAAFTLFLCFVGLKGAITDEEFHGKTGKIYIIKEGRHNSNNRIPKLYLFRKNKKQKISRCFKFSNSCLYKIEGPNNYAINKLTGFSMGLFDEPMTNSYRFGWNCCKENGKISMYAFYHVNKRMLYEYMGDIPTEKDHTFIIEKDIDYVNFSIIDKKTNEEILKTSVVLNFKKKWCFGWRLFPYFGGTCKAPHDILLFY